VNLGERTARRVLIDLGPLRRSRDLRYLVLGELIAELGTQLSTVAVPYQVYQLTRSSLDVGLVSLAQLIPLIAGSLLGGSAVDAIDRRRVLMVAQALLAGAGVRFVYWMDVASLGIAVLMTFFISPQPPVGEAGHRPGLRSVIEGLRFVRGRQAIQGAYLIDINAMVFGMPRALFPALATTLFGGGASTLGFLYAAPGAGALVGAVTTGWVGRIRRQGLAVIVAVITWGAAITCFGLVPWLPGALVLLAVAGWADVISAVFRSTIIQLAVPDALRGRLSGLQMAVVSGGPRIGDLEAGAVAAGFGDTVSVVSGGLACIAGALLLARSLPGFRQQRTPEGPSRGGMLEGPAGPERSCRSGTPEGRAGPERSCRRAVPGLNDRSGTGCVSRRQTPTETGPFG
jgi:MFS family permease